MESSWQVGFARFALADEKKEVSLLRERILGRRPVRDALAGFQIKSEARKHSPSDEVGRGEQEASQ